MTILGTIVNGQVRFDNPIDLPEGTRVKVMTEESKPCDFEEDLEALRESLEDVKAGRYVLARDVLKDIAIRNGLPLEEGE